MKLFASLSRLLLASAIPLGLSMPMNSSHAAAPWNPPVFVSPTGVSSIEDAVLSVNASNNGVAIWVEGAISDMFRTIHAASYTFGSGWGPDLTISDTSLDSFGNPNFPFPGDPDVAMNASGYAVGVWEGEQVIDQFGNTMFGIFAATRSSSGVWSPQQRVSDFNIVDPLFDTQNPAIAVNDAGLAVVVWNQVETPSPTNAFFVMASFLPFGGSWTTPVQLDAVLTGDLEDTPRVAINSSGNAAAVWIVGTVIGNFAIDAATFNPGTSTWTTVTLDPSPDTFSLPKVAIDKNGNAVATWIKQVGSVTEAVSSSFTPGIGWGPIVVISSTAANDVELVMDSSGNATAMWDDFSTGSEQVFSSTLPLGGTWSTPTQISTVGLNNGIDVGLVSRPLAVDAQGNVIAIILQGDNSTLQSISRFVQGGWQAPIDIFSAVDPVSTNIGIGSCGFALSLWIAGPDINSLRVQSADTFGLVPPPAGFRGKRCCDKFATQKVCFSLLQWSPQPACISSFQLQRNGVLIATLPGSSTSFHDRVCHKNDVVTYTLTATNSSGVVGAPATITVP
jgi:hypothetical protein